MSSAPPAGGQEKLPDQTPGTSDPMLAAAVRIQRRRHRWALATARFGPHLAGREDIVFADDDGVVFVPAGQVDTVLAAAGQIGEVERDQARRIRRARRCASRPPSMITWPSMALIRPAPSGSTCAAPAEPSKNGRIEASGCQPPGRPPEQPRRR